MPVRPRQRRPDRGGYNPYGSYSADSVSSSSYTRASALNPSSIEDQEEIAYAVETGTGGITPLLFMHDSILANSTAHPLHGFGDWLEAQVMPYRGSLLAIVVHSSAVVTAGTLSFAFYVDDTATGASFAYPSGVTSYVAKFNKGTYGWASDSTVAIKYTTSSGYLPISANYEVYAYVTLDQSEVQ